MNFFIFWVRWSALSFPWEKNSIFNCMVDCSCPNCKIKKKQYVVFYLVKLQNMYNPLYVLRQYNKTHKILQHKFLPQFHVRVKVLLLLYQNAGVYTIERRSEMNAGNAGGAFKSSMMRVYWRVLIDVFQVRGKRGHYFTLYQGRIQAFFHISQKFRHYRGAWLDGRGTLVDQPFHSIQ